jgi:hypothetical protein
MKTIKILAILYIIIKLGTESAQAQMAQTLKYQELIGIGSVRTGNPDTVFCIGNTSGSCRMDCCFTNWMKLTNKMIVPFFVANKNSSDLLYNPIIINGTNRKLSGKSGFIGGEGTSRLFNGKWERLTGKPIADTTTLFLYPLRRINTSSLSDNRLYRISANIFNMTMSSIYPRKYTL